jgi:hypothetical protein
MKLRIFYLKKLALMTQIKAICGGKDDAHNSGF